MLRGDAAIESHVAGTARVPVSTRLAIYGGGYGARLTEALQMNFPALAKLLGDADFETVAAAYIGSHDSSFASIRYYGHQLAQFLARAEAYAARPWLAELAEWEWAMTETFDAANADVIDAGAMARVSPEHWSDLRLRWHPSIGRLKLTWNVPQLWKALTSETQPPLPSATAEPGQWLLWRQELEIFFRLLTPPEGAALGAVRDGCSFGEMCDLLCAWVGESAAPGNAAAYLREWLQSGLIVEIDGI